MPETPTPHLESLVAVLNEQFKTMKESLTRMETTTKESLARIETKIDSQAEANALRDKDFMEYRASADLRYLEHKNETDRRITDIENRLASYSRTIKIIGGSTGTIIIGLVLAALKAAFHW